MEVTCSSVTSPDSDRTTRRYIPGDRALHCLLFIGGAGALSIWDIFRYHYLRLQDVLYLVSQKNTESPSPPPHPHIFETV
jgi:hypothetical protein